MNTKEPGWARSKQASWKLLAHSLFTQRSLALRRPAAFFCMMGGSELQHQSCGNDLAGFFFMLNAYSFVSLQGLAFRSPHL
jgi:hypothetical protein